MLTYSLDPVTSVSSLDIQCNVGASSPVSVSQTITNVAAGTSMSIHASQAIYHPGPYMVYLAKVPAGQTAATWTPSGSVWFKIAEYGLKSTNPAVWYSDNQSLLPVTIPAATPSGQYLIRFEQIGLHVASSTNGAQFYLSCGQINVTGGGSGTPSPLVAFPGAYSNTDPGLLINIYNPAITSYTFPGPAVWTG